MVAVRLVRFVGNVAQPGSINDDDTSAPSIRMAKQPTPLANAVALTTVTAAADGEGGGRGIERSESSRLSNVPPCVVARRKVRNVWQQ